MSARPLTGGTLRINVSRNDLFTDPGRSYDTTSWSLLYTTQLLLMNRPELPGKAGAVLYAEAATSMPAVSTDGTIYSFRIRPGLRFSDGTSVTAAAYRRAWERNLSPKMGSPEGVNDQFQNVIVGAKAFNDGNARTIRGITAHGLILTFRLTKPNPTFVAYLAMPWFGAVKTDMPYTSTGVTTSYPSAGPYYIQSRVVGQAVVEARNPYYHGPRAANPDRIVWATNTDQATSLLQVEAGEVDIDALGPPAVSLAQLASRYGINKRRFFVGPTSCLGFWALNTSRPPFSNVAYRKAVNWAIDPAAMVRVLGKYAAQRTGQILVPGIPGYNPYHLYAFRGADLSQARHYAPNGIPGTVVVVHDLLTADINIAQVVEYDLNRFGVKTKDVGLPSSVYGETVGTRGADMDMAIAAWCADYSDPFDFINVLLDGRSIRAKNNLNSSYLNDPSLNKAMDSAASLTGTARAHAYASLDREIMTRYVPWIPYAIYNGVFLVSSRIRNFIYNPYFGTPDYNALSVR